MADVELLRVRSGPLGLLSGVSAVFFGLRRIAGDAELRRLAVIPMALTAVLYVGLVALAVTFADDLLALVWARPEAGLLHVLWVVLVPLVVLALLVPVALLFSAVAEAIGGPFYDRMAMRVLRTHGLPAEDPGFFAGTLPDLLRSLAYTAVGLTFAALSLIPVVGVPFGVVASAVAWLGLGAAAINPALTVSRQPVGARVRYALAHAPTMLGLGAVVALSFLVPLLGLVALPAAVVGATELYARSSCPTPGAAAVYSA